MVYLKKLFYKITSKIIRDELRFIRVQRPITNISGPLYKQNHYKIEIDITYKCNLKCMNCNRSCRQAASEECMSVEQIEKFIKESKEQKRKWEQITIAGGEPTLHPNIFDIIQLLLSYKKNFSPNTRLEFVTNGYGYEVNSVLSKIPSEVVIRNTKKQPIPFCFYPFNTAPIDVGKYKYADYSNGCSVVQICGVGLTRYGYYTSSVAGGIDRVCGFNIGRKSLPSLDDSMVDQRKILCRYCGHFKEFINEITKEEKISLSWEKAYENYQNKKPYLSLY